MRRSIEYTTEPPLLASNRALIGCPGTGPLASCPHGNNWAIGSDDPRRHGKPFPRIPAMCFASPHDQGDSPWVAAVGDDDRPGGGGGRGRLLLVGIGQPLLLDPSSRHDVRSGGRWGTG